MRLLRHLCVLCAALLSVSPLIAQPISQEIAPGVRRRLHNGWQVTPVGTHQKTGDMLLGCALSPDGKTLAFVNAGYNAHHLYLANAITGKIRQTLELKAAWNGVAWARDGNTVYVSGGGQPQVHVFTRKYDGNFEPSAPFLLPGLKHEPDAKKGEKQAYVSGLAVSADGKTLYAANFASDTIFALNLPDGAVKAKVTLPPNAHPYCLRLSPDGKSLYVSQLALGNVAVLKASDLSEPRFITTDGHPNDLLFAPDGRLFVSCGNGDSVLAIDPATGLTRERISVSLSRRALAGTTPNALAIAPDGKTLYVANADNNDVAMIDIGVKGQSRVEGFIPTGWYPTLVFVTPDGKNLLIGSGRGLGAGPNSPKLFPKERVRADRKGVYIGTLAHGFLSMLAIPDEKKIAGYTRQVFENTPYRDTVVINPPSPPRRGSNPIPSRLGDKSPIKYLLYIIRENRTYDQVLGDLKGYDGKPRGNGDPDLTLFGEEVTPNAHELSRQYVTLDNLFCNGDVSGSGHPWSTGAYATDIGERAWMLSYSGHADWPLLDLDIFPPSGRIWDVCERMDIPFVSYYFTWTTTNTQRNMPEKWATGFSARRDTENADIFISDLKDYERNNNMPRFMIMSLREDHTSGTSPGKPTPQACVASNDLAIGRIVEACSRSKYWKDMAIFVIEDDGQDGPDHVEAHRTVGLVISPYTRTGKVDNHFYTTVSMLRTMELILGLPPMSQYDAATSPMYSVFSRKADTTPYVAQQPRVDINARNKQTAYGASDSLAMDFSVPDRLTSAQVDTLNRILWHSIKGPDIPYPGSVRRTLFAQTGQPIIAEEEAEEAEDE